jgi:hypothetical protein
MMKWESSKRTVSESEYQEYLRLKKKEKKGKALAASLQKMQLQISIDRVEDHSIRQAFKELASSLENANKVIVQMKSEIKALSKASRD